MFALTDWSLSPFEGLERLPVIPWKLHKIRHPGALNPIGHRTTCGKPWNPDCPTGQERPDK
jgi:hypothetical protein